MGAQKRVHTTYSIHVHFNFNCNRSPFFLMLIKHTWCGQSATTKHTNNVEHANIRPPAKIIVYTLKHTDMSAVCVCINTNNMRHDNSASISRIIIAICAVCVCSRFVCAGTLAKTGTQIYIKWYCSRLAFAVASIVREKFQMSAYEATRNYLNSTARETVLYPAVTCIINSEISVSISLRKIYKIWPYIALKDMSNWNHTRHWLPVY